MGLVADRFLFGTASLGSRTRYPAACLVLKAAHDLGFRLFDTAPIYGACRAQSIIEASRLGSDRPGVVGKFLCANYGLARDLAKMFLLGCGPSAYRNFLDILLLHSSASRGHLTPAHIDSFIKRQIARHQGLRFLSWLVHAPSERLTLELDRMGLFTVYGYSGCLNERILEISPPVIQSDVDSILSFPLASCRSKTILVNQVYRYARANDINVASLYERILSLDPRVRIVVGATKPATVSRIVSLIDSI